MRTEPGAERSRLGLGAGLVRLTRVAMLHPSAWPVALAGFLARGGILLFILPVLVLPTPTGLATAFGPDIIALAMGAPTADFIRLIALSTAVALGGLVAASLLGAAADTILATWAVERLTDPSDGAVSIPPATPRLRLLARVALARVACHLPLAVSAVWAVSRIVDAVYREYVSPGDLAIALPLRVARDVPEAIAVVLAAWLFGEALGGLAARAIVLERRPTADAIRRALVSLAAHPVASVAGLIAGSVVLVGLGGPPIIVGTLVWGQVRHSLLGTPDLAVVLPASLAFVAIWLLALAVTAAAVTWRSVLWTAYAIRFGHVGRAPAVAPLTTKEAVPASA